MENVSQILENSALNYANDIVDQNKDIIFLSDNSSVHDLERFSKTKRRMNGQFGTTSIKALAQFAESTINQSSEVDTPSCFIGENGNAKLILNFGTIETPLHQDLKASVQLGQTAVFKAIDRLRDERLSQRDLAEFIEDFHTYVKALDKDGNEINQSVAIAAIRNMSIESNSSVNQTTEEYRDTSSAFASVEAKFKDATPAYLKFDIPAFNEIENREFVFRISVLTSDNKIKLALRCPKWDEVIESINLEFQEKLSEQLEPLGVKTFIGNWN